MQRLVMLFGLGFQLISTMAWAYSGGTGEPNDPYQIATAADLIELGNDPCNYDKCFILTADIDLDPNLPGGRVFDRAVIAPNLEYPNSQTTYFNGHLDGQGYSIKGLTIKSSVSYLGLISRIGNEGIVTQICLLSGSIHVELSGQHYYMGALAGENQGVISDCYSNVSIRGNMSVGGLVGINRGIIFNSYCSGLVQAKYSEIGGFVGANQGTIAYCYSSAEAIGFDRVGGLVGYNSGCIKSCYSADSVSGVECIGGLVGVNQSGDITTSYSIGLVSGDTDTGGLVGWNDYGTINMSFWDIETSVLDFSCGGIGLTTDEMMDANILALNGFANDPNWTLEANQNYPHLSWEDTKGEIIFSPVLNWIDGTGTIQDPYQIFTLEQFSRITKAGLFADKHLVMRNDLDLSGITWSQAVFPYFEGRFDGNGHILSHMNILGRDYLGLFGLLGPGAEITNLRLEAMDVNGIGQYVGGLVGYNNQGAVIGVQGDGRIVGDYKVGGLVGYNHYGNIISSYTTGSVRGGSSVGGLVGHNFYGNIVSDYSNSSVGGKTAGGLVGYNEYGSISSSYSTGFVSGGQNVGGLVGRDYGYGGITSSFWDEITSGCVTSDGGIGLTSSKMNDINIYLNAGWDFVDEIANGTCNYWYLREGTYPCLTFFSDFVPVEPNGVGTLESPYLIFDVNELGFVWRYPSSSYLLESDIDLSNITWGMAVIPWFGGYFDFQGFNISSLNIESGAGHLGLFGQLSPQAKIFNMSLIGVDITGLGHYIGGGVGRNSGIVKTSRSIGLVNGGTNVGGLAGANEGIILSSYSSGFVSATHYCLGGLVGNNSGQIVASFQTGLVRNGKNSIGGLVRFGPVGDVVSSFWDTETSGQAVSYGGTGLITTEMQNINTFLDAGWDFVDETGNGTEDIWWMPEGDYPRLWWEEVN